MLVRSAWTGPLPRLASSHWLGHLPSLASPVASLLYKKKLSGTEKSVTEKSGTEVRRTPDVKLRFVGFIRFVSFIFGHGQLLRFVAVMVWSS